jgi:hypothetical protein
MYAREQEKDDGMSALAVVDTIEKDTGLRLCVQTIQKKVSAGNIGTSPLRQGAKGHIPDRHYRSLCLAYESFVTINQLNGTMRACHPKRIRPLVHKVIHGDSDNWESLFKRVQKDTTINLRRQKAKNAEDRRIRWNTEKKLSAWFDNFEEDIDHT